MRCHRRRCNPRSVPDRHRIRLCVLESGWKFTYSSSADSTLGVAYTSNGSSWSASGSRSVSSNTAYDYTTEVPHDRRVYNLWKYRDYNQTCSWIWWSKPYSFFGRGQTTYMSHPVYTYCGGSQGVGAVVNKTGGTAYTYSNSLTVKGVGLTAQTGWSPSEKISFTFQATGNVCGNTSAGPAGAPVVEASHF